MNVKVRQYSANIRHTFCISIVNRYICIQSITKYINNYDEYPKGARLLVEPVLCETVIDDPRGCRGVEQYNINRFLKIDNHGIPIPNLHAIIELAKKDYIV